MSLPSLPSLPPWSSTAAIANAVNATDASSDVDNVAASIAKAAATIDATGRLQQHTQHQNQYTDENFNDYLFRFLLFRADHGQHAIPDDSAAGTNESNALLCRWVNFTNSQRQSGQLSAERLKVLNSINFPWSHTNDANKKESTEGMINTIRNASTNSTRLSGASQPTTNQTQTAGAIQTKPKDEKSLKSAAATTQINPIANTANFLCATQRQNNSSLASQNISKKRKTTTGTSSAFPFGISDKQFTKFLTQLQTFRAKHGPSSTPTYSSKRATERSLHASIKQINTYFQNGELTVDQINQLNSVNFPWSLSRDAKWNMHFRSLQEYNARFGDTNVPKLWEEDKQLGVWVGEMRRLKKVVDGGGNTTILTEERIRLLESIGFQWSLRVKDLSWEERFQELCRFKEDYGHCHVPRNYEESPALGRWVGTQRELYKNRIDGKDKRIISDEHFESLDKLGFIWQVRQGNTNDADNADNTGNESYTNETLDWSEDNFKEFLFQLHLFRSKHGPEAVPSVESEKDDEIALASWIQQLDAFYESGDLSEEQYSILENVKLPWSHLNDDTWDESLNQLASYNDFHGDCNVSQCDGPLGQWVKNQRRGYKLFKEGKRTHLTEERIGQLETLDFQWVIRDKNALWNEKYDELRLFKAEYGHCDVPRWYKNKALGRFVLRQRELYRNKMAGKEKNVIKDEHIVKLEAIGFRWSTKQQQTKSSM